MAKPGPKQKYTDEELYEAALAAQKEEPLLSEAAVCGKLGVDVDYITDRSKKSDLILRAKKEMKAMRFMGWEREGIKGMKSKIFQATPFVWMTRNILGWSDKTEGTPNTLVVNQAAQQSNPLDKDTMIELIQLAREPLKAAKEARQNGQIKATEDSNKDSSQGDKSGPAVQ